MPRSGVKRKAAGAGLLATSPKKTKLSNAQEDEIVDDASYASEYSEDDSDADNDTQTADTPITPFSPSRNVYPSQLKTIPCTFEGCNKMFNRPARLASHLRSHTNERPFVCSYEGCDKAYTESKHLTQHVKGTHLQERSYSCDWEGCTKTFLTGTRLRRHKEAHEGHDRFRCTAYPPCNQTFRKHQTLQRHIRSDHLSLTRFPCTYVEEGTGIRCDAGFDSAGSLRKHEDRVHGAYKFFCEECTVPSPADSTPRPMGFRTKTELTKHMKTMHIDCLFCDLSFKSRSDLQRHTETIHADSTIPKPEAEKNVLCTYPGCTKKFTKKSNMDAHFRSIHQGQRFTCGGFDLSGSSAVPGWNGGNACGRDFVSKVNLEDHVRTQHLGLPSLVNANRVKGTSDKSNKKVKAEEDVDPIALLTGATYGQEKGRNMSCSVDGCPWLFIRKYDMEQHVRTKHEIHDETFNDGLEAATNAALESMFAPMNDQNPTPSLIDPQLDLEWELQQQAANGGQFWIGGGDMTQANTPAGDSWDAEMDEMRRLIDADINGGVDGDLEFEQLVDPALSGL